MSQINIELIKNCLLRGCPCDSADSGTKRWSLKPPPECYWKCPGEVSVTLDPGDIIVVNTNWWSHSTKVLGAAVSVTITNEYEM